MARNQYREFEREVFSKLGRDKEVPRKARQFVNRVQAYARAQITADMAAYESTGMGGYSTGKFALSIKVRRIKRVSSFLAGRDDAKLPQYQVYSDDPKAHFLEFGTKEDNPNSRSPWGRWTPTPKYATFAKTALAFGGTPDGR